MGSPFLCLSSVAACPKPGNLGDGPQFADADRGLAMQREVHHESLRAKYVARPSETAIFEPRIFLVRHFADEAHDLWIFILDDSEQSPSTVQLRSSEMSVVGRSITLMNPNL